MQKIIFTLLALIIIIGDLSAQHKKTRKVKESLIIEKKTTYTEKQKKYIKTNKELAQEELSMAVAAYRTKQYELAKKALLNFSKLNENEYTEEKSYASLIEAKVLYAKGRIIEADRILKTLEADASLPEPIRGEVIFDRGILFTKEKRYEDALTNFINVLELKLETILHKKTLLYLRACTPLVSVMSLLQVAETTSSQDVKTAIFEMLTVAPIKDMLNPTMIQESLTTLKHRSDVTAKLLVAILAFEKKLARSQTENSLAVGCLLPLEFEMFDGAYEHGIGIQMINGIIDAAFENNAKSNSKQLTEIYVERTDNLQGEKELLLATQRLIDEKNSDIIYGPVYSAEALAIGTYCRNKQIVMITPTATDERIPASFINSFLLNPTFYERGRAAAKFIMTDMQDVKHQLRFALIYQNEDPKEKQMVDGFRNEILKANHVISWEVKLPSAFSSLKKYIDSLHLRFDELKGYDTTFYDAIYIPIPDYKKGVIVLSQLKLYNIVGQIIAPGEWGQPNILKKYHDIMDGMIYITDMNIENTTQTREIRKKFKEKIGDEPEEYYWVGFGSFSFIAATIQKSAIQHNKIYAATLLKQSNRFYAIYREIFFGNENVNQEMNILEYTGGVSNVIRLEKKNKQLNNPVTK